eukprot:CAMPEP_0206262300 /NCGR_PEP_ID=MMETSP0047_2-20121206/28158_1 /ASSEMBLY_ACC=CAM_ASM_000192 /TAXON_ID=195065 /ORGANISM="Chroomonas mesostigmatica_cf, Strain CCMP1168" /LENGTH=329 /DNA_ID=CAMNT_0053689659 /DNA_START=27 /DNA_END=1018 /DNA_ORIENTATION=+
MTGNITSEACGFYMRVNATAMEFETFYSKAMHYTIMVTVVSCVQVLLLARQIEYTTRRNNSTQISLLCVGHQAILDSYLCLMHLTAGLAVESLFNAFATAAFFKFMIFSVFEMRYLLIVWKGRRPEMLREGWQTIRRELSKLYSRFYGCMLAGMVLVFQMRKHPTACAIIVYGFWLPQIGHAAFHGHKKPMQLRYIIGMSASRLCIPLYALACPSNFFKLEPNYTASLVLVLWMAFQACILVAQNLKRASVLCPKGMAACRLQLLQAPAKGHAGGGGARLCNLYDACGRGRGCCGDDALRPLFPSPVLTEMECDQARVPRVPKTDPVLG